MVKLTLIYIGCNNCYWITIYNVTKLGGNKFLNGIILGTAELSAGIFAGFLISKSSPKIAFQICAVFAIVFNALNQFVVPHDSLLSYMTLALAILGVGGVYTAIYVIIYAVMPKEQVGGAMVLIITFGVSLSLFAPIIALYDTPIPFLALTAMMCSSAFFTCLLPGLGAPDKKLDQEDHLMDGWEAHENQLSKAQASVLRGTSMMNLTIDKNYDPNVASSFAIYAAREGFVPAVNYSTMMSQNVSQMRTMLGAEAGGLSISLVRRYQPNIANDSNYINVN